MRLLPRCTHRNDKFIKWDCHAALAMTLLFLIARERERDSLER